ncbi:MAG: trehalose operon repressor [Peptostreptococcaceae bacterium]
MSLNKYLNIYNYLKDKIKTNEFEAGKKLPSESELTSLFGVSRNTVRRALDMLASDGFVTSVHGKGVFVIEKQPMNFLVGGLQSFKEVSNCNNLNFNTTIPVFDSIKVDEVLAKKSNFQVGSQVLNILRVRSIDKENVILDVNYFNSNIIKGLTKEIAYGSIYDYIENVLNLKISGAQKVISVEVASDLDKSYLDLDDTNLVAVITNYVYLDDGTLFEYTQSRHRPDRFTFNTFARRFY